MFVLVLFLFAIPLVAADTSTASPEVSNFQVINTNTDPTYKGDMNLGIPLFDIPGRGGLGFSLGLSYQAGIKTHQEASQVGLGWSLGTGSIIRGVNSYIDEKEYQGETTKNFAAVSCVVSNRDRADYGTSTECYSPEDATSCGPDYQLISCLGGCIPNAVSGCVGPGLNQQEPGKVLACVEDQYDLENSMVFECGPPTDYNFDPSFSCSGGQDLVECTGTCQEGIVGGCTDNALKKIYAKGSLMATSGNDDEGGNQDFYFLNSPVGATGMMFDNSPSKEFHPLSWSAVDIDYTTNGGTGEIEEFSVLSVDGTKYVFSEKGQVQPEGGSWSTVEVQKTYGGTQYAFDNDEIADLDPHEVCNPGVDCVSDYISGYSSSGGLARSYSYYVGEGLGHDEACNNAWICPYEYVDSTGMYLPGGDSYTQKLKNVNGQIPNYMLSDIYCSGPSCLSSSRYQLRVFRCKTSLCNGGPFGHINIIATGSEGLSSPDVMGMGGAYGDSAEYAPHKYYDKTAKHTDVWYLTEVMSHDYKDDGDGFVDEGDDGNWVKLSYEKYNTDYVDESPKYYSSIVVQGGLTDDEGWFNYDMDEQVGGNDVGVFTYLQHEGSEKIRGAQKTFRKTTKELIHVDNIETTTHRADFTYNSNTNDGVDELDSIDLVYKAASGDQNIFTYDFTYVSDSSANQLKDPSGTIGKGERTLDRIQKTGYAGTDEPATIFSYGSCNPLFDSDEYDDRGLKRDRTDSWGMYSSYMVGDNYEVENFPVSDGGDGCGANAWSLKSIRYPTGGVVTYDFEPNRYKFVPDSDSSNGDWLTLSSPELGGGIRVKNIRIEDGLEVSEVGYEYGDGVATRRPNEVYDNVAQETKYIMPWDYPGAGSEVYIGYRDITTKSPLDGSYGRVVYDFKDAYECACPGGNCANPADCADENWNECAGHGINVVDFQTGEYKCYGGYLTSNSWKRDYVDYVTYYDAGGSSVKTVDNDYDTSVVKYEWEMTNDYVDPRTGLSQDDVITYTKRSVFPKVSGSSTALDGVTNEINYVYDSNTGMVTETLEMSSSGNRRTETSYAHNIYGEMDTKNMLSQVNLVKIYDVGDNNRLVKQSETTWASFNGGDWYPHQSYEGVGSDRKRVITMGSYDDYGNLLSSTDAKGYISTFIYGNNGACTGTGEDMNHAVLTCVKNAKMHEVKTRYDSKGRIDEITDQNGDPTAYGYDDLSRLESVTNPTGGETSYIYKYALDFGDVSDLNLNEIEITQKIDGSQDFVSRKLTDGVGKELQTQAVVDSEYVIVQDTEFNEIFKVDAKTKPVKVVSNQGKIIQGANPIMRFFIEKGIIEPKGWENNYIIDVYEKGEQSNPEIKFEIDYDLDPLARVDKAYPLGRTQSSLYTNTDYSNGGGGLRKVSVRDEEGVLTDSYYDQYGNVKKVVLGSEAKQIDYDYSILGELEEINDAGVITTNNYNTLGEIETTYNPDSGLSTYTYDLNGNVETFTDARGWVTFFHYDNLNRVDSVDVNEGSGHVTRVDYVYDTGCGPSSNQIGKLCSLSNYDPDGSLISTIRYGYDSVGNIERITASTSRTGETREIDYGYDDANNIDSITDLTGGTVIIYGYNKLNQLESMTAYAGGPTITAYYEYNPTGTLSNITYGNGVFTDYEYNDRDWVERITIGEDLLDESYLYGDAGNIERLDDNLDGTFATFGYTDLYQLDEVRAESSSTSDYYDGLGISYVYDTEGKGNRYSRNVYGDENNGMVWDETYTYDDPDVPEVDNRLMHTVEDGCDYDYDSVGNMFLKECGSESTTFQYDYNNLITQINLPDQTIMKFEYDVLGRRIWKEVTYGDGSKDETFYWYGLGINPFVEHRIGEEGSGAECGDGIVEGEEVCESDGDCPAGYRCKYDCTECYPYTPSCFPEGTKILMADGSEKNIEDVQVGEYVLGKYGKAEVLELESPIREGYYLITFEDGSELKVTNEHPIYSRIGEFEGWASIYPQETYRESKLFVNKLTENNKVLTMNGWVDIKEIEYFEGSVQTYNLKSVKGNTFYAGGVLVHNKDPYMAVDFIGGEDPGDLPDNG